MGPLERSAMKPAGRRELVEVVGPGRNPCGTSSALDRVGWDGSATASRSSRETFVGIDVGRAERRR